MLRDHGIDDDVQLRKFSFNKCSEVRVLSFKHYSLIVHQTLLFKRAQSLKAHVNCIDLMCVFIWKKMCF